MNEENSMKSTTSHEDQFSPEPTPQEEEAWREMERRQSVPVAQEPAASAEPLFWYRPVAAQETETALDRYRASGVGVEEKDPLEQLRFFCSLAMSGQDWLDVEPFFDAVAAQAQPEDDSIALDRLADYIADTWPMDKKYGLEEICQRLHAMWPGEFIPLEKLAHNEPNMQEALRALLLYWMRFQKSDRNQQDAYNILAKSAQHAWKFAQSEMERADTAQQPVSGADGLPAQWRDNLHAFLDAAAGEGLVLAGVDAADLYCAVFPDEYAAAVSGIAPSKPQPSGNAPLADDTRVGILADSSYINGLRTGYALGQAGNEAGLQQIIGATRAQISEARADIKGQPFGNAGELPPLPEPGMTSFDYGSAIHWFTGTQMQAYARAALAAQASGKTQPNIKEMLKDPIIVHQNMCRGIIAPITFDMLAHVLGDEAKREWIAAQASGLDAQDPLQPAADWLVSAGCGTHAVAGKLMIGINRAERLVDAARAAAKGE